MNSTGENNRVDIVRLTKAAAEAAEIGRWDAVVQCYCERGAFLETMQARVSEAEDLLKLDEEIRHRVNTAQAVLMALLGEAAATRQRLQDLHQRLGVQPSTSVSLSMKV